MFLSLIAAVVLGVYAPVSDAEPAAVRRPRIYAHADDGPAPNAWRTPRCAAGAKVGFQSRGLFPVDSPVFYTSRRELPLPAFPELARKVRIEGAVHVEAVERVVLRWRFRPFSQEGRAVPAIGRFVVEFRRLDNDAWKRIAAGQ